MHSDDRYETRCIQVAEEVEAVLGRQVTRFRAMCAEHGAVQATKRLIHAQRPSDTFSVLWDKGRLDLAPSRKGPERGRPRPARQRPRPAKEHFQPPGARACGAVPTGTPGTP